MRSPKECRWSGRGVHSLLSGDTVGRRGGAGPCQRVGAAVGTVQSGAGRLGAAAAAGTVPDAAAPDLTSSGGRSRLAAPSERMPSEPLRRPGPSSLRRRPTLPAVGAVVGSPPCPERVSSEPLAAAGTVPAAARPTLPAEGPPSAHPLARSERPRSRSGGRAVARADLSALPPCKSMADAFQLFSLGQGFCPRNSWNAH